MDKPNFLQQVEEQLKKLRTKDIEIMEEARKSGQAKFGNNVTDYVRKMLVLTAVQNKVNDFQPAKIEVSFNSEDMMSASIRYLKTYDWFKEYRTDMVDGKTVINYTIDDSKINNGYRRYLNTTFGTQIPEISNGVIEVDNDLLAAIVSYQEIGR